MTKKKGNRSAKFALILALAALLVVSACSKGGKEPAEGSGSSPAANTGSQETPAGSGETGGDPYLGKFEPGIEISTVRIVNDTYKYPEGQNIDNNVWTQLIEEKLGIKIKNVWVVSGDQPGGQGEQKMNVSIASGDLPEFIPVNAKQLKQLQEAGQLMDLTEVYDKYASPLLKEVLNQDGPNALASATFGGKLMAIPNTGSSMDGASMIWVRSDWLKKLNLPEPKTMQDVLAISEAFATRDPDGNNKNDTYGLALNKDLYGGFADMTGFMNGYHAYPKLWIKDANGNLVYGSIQPEVKTALAKLQELYAKGQIDKEFGVKDGGKTAELTTSNRIGLEFGQMWNPYWPLIDNKKKNPDAEWQSYPIVSADDQPAITQVPFAVPQYYAVKKGTQNPEALLKIMNLFEEMGWGKSASVENYVKYYTGDGFMKANYNPFVAWPPKKNLDIHLSVQKALETGDTSALNVEQKDAYDKFIAYRDKSSDDPLLWGNERLIGTNGAFAVINRYLTENRMKPNEFFGAPTPAMVEKEATLQKRELEVFTKIIMGDSIDTFDKFVEDWKKLGGDQITEEVNEWAKSR